MKKLKIKSLKGVTTALLAGTLLTVTACKDSQKHLLKDKDQSETVQTKTKAPAMDIHTAAFFGNLNAIQQHINAGSDLNKKDDYGSTPLISAVIFGKTEVAILLIEAGADLNVTNNEGSTALHSAAFFCRTKIVEALLENGADKNLRNNFGSTPLESVTGPFDLVKPVYDQISKDLGTLGLKLDYAYLEKTRPVIAEMLR